MNFAKVFNVVGKALLIETIFMLLAFVVGLCYGETQDILAFSVAIASTGVLGAVFTFVIKTKKKKFCARDGFLSVGLCWILMSLFATIPYILSGSIKDFCSAFFECVSGFTTTGGSIISDVTKLSHGILLWRELTHWIGGMGILVFMLAFFPGSGTDSVYIFGAESTGYRSDKIVAKMRFTALILYIIYIAFTIIETILLAFKIPLFDAVIHAMGTVSTGGFSCNIQSIQGYNSPYVEAVISVFMFLCSLNFTLFFLLMLGNFKEVLKNEELRVYIIILVVSIFSIALSIISIYKNFGDALRYSVFQVLTCTSTTGYYSTDFTTWPTIAKTIMIILMFGGGMAGSTAGGMKISRICVSFKSASSDLRKIYHPNKISVIKFDGKVLSDNDVISVRTFILYYFAILIFSALLMAILGCFSTNATSIEENFTATLSAISNVGPFFGNATAFAGDFTCFNWAQKLLLSFVMLFGRLEIFPMILVFAPSLWKYKN